MSSSDFSSNISEWTLVSTESSVKVGDEVEVFREEVVLTGFNDGRDALRMLMLFQIPRDGRRAWRSFNRSSLCRVASCGCERRLWKARLAGRGQHRNGMVTGER